MHVLALATCLLAVGFDDEKSDPKKIDQHSLQGIWLIVGLDTEGRPEPARNYQGNTLTFERDRAVLKEGLFPPVEFAVTLDATRTPKHIDLISRNGRVPGIYKLDGDDLILCFGLGGPRPAEFATKPGGGTETFLLKRSRWERYTDKTLGFSVDLPDKPEETRSVNSPISTVLTVRDPAEHVVFTVSVTSLPESPTAALTTAKKKLLAEIAGPGKPTIDTDKDCETAGHPGRELAISVSGPGGRERTLRARLFVVGDSLYALVVAGTEEGTRSKSVDRFWNSFKFQPEKK